MALSGVKTAEMPKRFLLALLLKISIITSQKDYLTFQFAKERLFGF